MNAIEVSLIPCYRCKMGLYHTLGNSELNISKIGFGSWAIGGEWEWGWGIQEDAESLDALHYAFDVGVNWVDTAPVYGLGHSEEVVGKALHQTDKEVFVCTKCGFRWDQNQEITPSLKAKSIRAEVEASLKRLKRDVIDLYQIHWPNPEEEIVEAAQTLQKLQEEGKIRYIGVSNFSVAHIERVQEFCSITTLQPPYSLIERTVETDVFPYCIENGITSIVYSPMASGMLSGRMSRERIEKMDNDWRKTSPNFMEPALTRNLELVDVIRSIGNEISLSVGAIATLWTLRHPAVSGAILGLRNKNQVALVSEILNASVSDEVWAKLDSKLATIM